MDEIVNAVKAPFDSTVTPPSAPTMALTWGVIGLLLSRLVGR